MSEDRYSQWDNVGYSYANEEVPLTDLIERIHSTLCTSLFKAVPTAYGELSNNIQPVKKQLRDYVAQVADNYHSVPFHSFRHAAQVYFNASHLAELASSHPGTWSMSSAHAFCLLFSALIHDLDHRGITNSQMIKEDYHGLFTKYPDGSLAEHNSVDVAFAFLNESKYEELRKSIATLNLGPSSSATSLVYSTHQNDLSSFTSLVTTLVLSTDIMNPERTASCRTKWNEAFHPQNMIEVQPSENTSKKDEVILEHLLQLADIGHCTQRWETMILWNKRLLAELIIASKQGKGVDPSGGWFDGQMTFCSSYVIPLTERIRLGGIFSSTMSKIFLEGALRNKSRWMNESMVLLDQIKEVSKSNTHSSIDNIKVDGQSDKDIHTVDLGTKISRNVDEPDEHTLSRLSFATTAPSSIYSGSLDSGLSSQPNIWSRLTHWSDVGRQEDESCCSMIIFWICMLPKHCRSGILTIKRHPLILLISLSAFAALCTLGLFFVKYLQHWNDQERSVTALHAIDDIGKVIADAFNQMLLPMYSLSQFIIQQSDFHSLPMLIDNTTFKYGSQTFRNVTGLCSNDDNRYSALFNNIANGILFSSNFSMTKVGSAVTDIRAVPYGVQCLIYPPTNVTATAVGNDWRLESKTSIRSILQYTVLDNELYTTGPLVRNSREIYCSHLSVNMPNYTFTYENTTRSSWGFIMVFFDWTKVKENIKLDALFQAHDLGYNITGSARPGDVSTEYIVANSSSFSSLKAEDIVSSRIDTNYGQWVIEAGFLHSSDLYQDLRWLRVIVVCVSLALSFLLMLSLITRQKHKDLLYKMMPPSAIRKIGRGDTVIEKYDLVTIFFCDIVGFTTMAGEMTPLLVMEMLNDLYSQLDMLTVKHKVYKVETIGDCFMAVGGAPERCTAVLAAQKITLFALDVLDCVKSFETRGGDRISIRVGLASGSVVAGVVGNMMPRYCFFGDTVNFASRMESTSKEMKIQCNDLTYQLLQNAPDFSFNFEERHDGPDYGVFVKGKGHIHTWWVSGANPLIKGDP